MPDLRCICRLKGHEERVWCVAWRPCADPPQLASCGSDRTIRIWGLRPAGDAESEADWVLLSEIDASDRHSRTLRCITWASNGDLAAVASFDATTSLWREVQERDPDEASGMFECCGLITGHENEVKSADFSPSGEYFATCSRDKSVWIYETDKHFEYECVAVLQSHTQDIKMVKWHPSQDVLFSVSYDDKIKVWGPDGDDWDCKETLEGHASTVWCLSWDPVGARFVTCSDDRTLRFWASEENASQASSASTQQAVKGPSVAAAAFMTPLFRASLGPGAANAAPQMPELDLQAPIDATCSWTCVATVEGHHPRPIYSCDWLPFALDGNAACIATACGDDCVRIFKPQDHSGLSGWTCAAVAEAHRGDANVVAWCPRPLPQGAALLASAGDDAEIALWRFGSN